MKLIDFETLFENKLARYMKENAGKYTQEQWETLIPKLYRRYGDTFLKSAGATPREFFEKMSDRELCDYLEGCQREKIAISDFLLRELEKRECPIELLSLAREADEELLLLILDAAGESARAGELYFSVLTGNASEKVKDAAADKLRSLSLENFLDRAIACYNAHQEEEYILELLSSGDCRDERIFEILMRELERADERLPVVAGLVARYGDERALPLLFKRIDSGETGFVAYRELLCAIEALGGTYEKQRDFSSDKDYVRIKEESEKESKS